MTAVATVVAQCVYSRDIWGSLLTSDRFSRLTRPANRRHWPRRTDGWICRLFRFSQQHAKQHLYGPHLDGRVADIQLMTALAARHLISGSNQIETEARRFSAAAEPNSEQGSQRQLWMSQLFQMTMNIRKHRNKIPLVRFRKMLERMIEYGLSLADGFLAQTIAFFRQTHFCHAPV